jgi:hypothetical protein
MNGKNLIGIGVIAALAMTFGVDRAVRAEEKEKEVQLADVPAAVKATIEAQKPGQHPKAVSSEKDNGKTVYEAEFESNGKTSSLNIGENGAVLESETEIAIADLPAAVTAAIKSEFAGATVELAENVHVEFYEVEVKTEGKIHEVKILPNGAIIEGDENGEDEDGDKDDDDENHEHKDKDHDHEHHDRKHHGDKDDDDEDDEDEDENN